MAPIHTETYHGYEINIVSDDDAERPDAWEDDSVFLVGFHRQFHVTTPAVEKPEDIDAMQETHHVFPLEAYIHSGVVLALANSREAARFPDRRWDVSLVGAVFVTKTEARTRAKAHKLAQGLIESWNDYLSGNVYRYEVTKDGEFIDGGSGYDGDYEADGGALYAAREAVDTTREVESLTTS